MYDFAAGTPAGRVGSAEEWQPSWPPSLRMMRALCRATLWWLMAV